MSDNVQRQTGRRFIVQGFRSFGSARPWHKAIWPKMGLRRACIYHLRRLSRIPADTHSIALGFAAGTFISFTPLIGFHLILAAALTVLLRGNIIASAVGTLVGNPLTFPLIWFAAYSLGAIVVGSGPDMGPDTLEPMATTGESWMESSTTFVSSFFWQIMVGGTLLGGAAGGMSYWLIRRSILAFRNRHKNHLLTRSIRRLQKV